MIPESGENFLIDLAYIVAALPGRFAKTFLLSLRFFSDFWTDSTLSIEISLFLVVNVLELVVISSIMSFTESLSSDRRLVLASSYSSTLLEKHSSL